jgi:hypothetical protein
MDRAEAAIFYGPKKWAGVAVFCDPGIFSTFALPLLGPLLLVAQESGYDTNIIGI